MPRVLLFLTVFLVSAVAMACNVPVFRYALERWQPDSCEIVVFHETELSVEDEQYVASLESASLAGNGTANLRVLRADRRAPLSADTAALWQQLSTQSAADKPQDSAPYLVARSKLARGHLVNHWQGTLSQARSGRLLDSPIRQELTKRLLAGDSVVWLVLKSQDKQQSQAACELLQSQFRGLSRRVELPEGIGLPGSELHSDVPLLLKFSLLEIDPTDPQEQFLVRLLSGFQPEEYAAGTPLAVPVFGRGRALEVIPTTQLNPNFIEDLTVFLCGACSCQVKEQNPGFDLLLTTDWNTRLFGEGVQPPAPQLPQGSGLGSGLGRGRPDVKDNSPVLVPIPSGRRKDNP